MRIRPAATIATIAAGTLALTACSGQATSTTENGDASDISIAVVHGWDEGIAVSVLWEAVLEEKGYDVDLEYVDIAPAFTGLAGGDFDVFMDSWLPNTHAAYIDEYGDDITELGVWNREGRNVIAVNADAPIDSLEELADNAELFDNRLVGTDPGAGLTAMTTEKAIPQYGLEDMEFLVSSSPSMLAELDGAMAEGRNIVVTLWQPHWAYSSYELKNLEDPLGAMGGDEDMTSFSREGFADDAPVAAGWLSDFTIDMDTLASLEEHLIVGNETAEYDGRIAEWIADNREWVDSLTSS
ncbi:glycine betaine ABC transporter substrate-binding protein [Mycetocola reblochoni]|uniref:Glycine betaine ABC transport system, glycine betaine-binding protein OpuAC n=2 Tax=Mycetocola reblochoni TaxID=331618 RepID=A0A1R4I996_9MICO|nr:glycine betaine ABC transporter substrate-binding protein [Mycetocola reblochoni]RLP69186.1 glycine betaine ABC transporter substrate-binding protein [Mycetocola reblochoni]SJN16425.1 Glycine betaine ABC transport system, glycine betaine-binding protein OpuAC [Mycetocola reblochoni REB411]